MTNEITIEDIALQFDRLCPSQVSTSRSGNGRQEAGHIGHDNDGVLSIGWYCAGGNCGDSLCEIPAESIQSLHETLAAMADGSCDEGSKLRDAVLAVGGKW